MTSSEFQQTTEFAKTSSVLPSAPPGYAAVAPPDVRASTDSQAPFLPQQSSQSAESTTCCLCLPFPEEVPPGAHFPRAVPNGTWMNSGPISCPICQGQGHFDKFGKPCTQGSILHLTACRACCGQGRWASIPPCERWEVCGSCSGLGGIDAFSRGCVPGTIHYRSDCATCGGRGVRVQVVAPPPPVLNQPVLSVPFPGIQIGLGMGIGTGHHHHHRSSCDNGGGEVACPVCKGNGYFDSFGKPCCQSSIHMATACRPCGGRGQLRMPFQVCATCSGLGAMDAFGKPCLPGGFHCREDCSCCGGRGLIPVDTCHTPVHAPAHHHHYHHVPQHHAHSHHHGHC